MQDTEKKTWVNVLSYTVMIAILILSLLISEGLISSVTWWFILVIKKKCFCFCLEMVGWCFYFVNSRASLTATLCFYLHWARHHHLHPHHHLHLHQQQLLYMQFQMLNEGTRVCFLELWAPSRPERRCCLHAPLLRGPVEPGGDGWRMLVPVRWPYRPIWPSSGPLWRSHRPLFCR